MKKMFEIFPALFELTPYKIIEPAIKNRSKNQEKRVNYDCNDDLFNGRLQLCNGDCQVNVDGTMIFICLGSTGSCGLFNMKLPEVFYTTLQPVIITGKHFTLTYLPVSN
jgi:hypothetical protein